MENNKFYIFKQKRLYLCNLKTIGTEYDMHIIYKSKSDGFNC